MSGYASREIDRIEQNNEKLGLYNFHFNLKSELGEVVKVTQTFRLSYRLFVCADSTIIK
jgi:hypothetical protein